MAGRKILVWIACRRYWPHGQEDCCQLSHVSAQPTAHPSYPCFSCPSSISTRVLKILLIVSVDSTSFPPFVTVQCVCKMAFLAYNCKKSFLSSRVSFRCPLLVGRSRQHRRGLSYWYQSSEVVIIMIVTVIMVETSW